ncbi:unnamed protein product [Prunus armeniaca]|uniref:Uncharacterized protein n=1 Tax=Prunus armeniaca TaxID=36596 RepID=A0A6J5V4B0_PRUAR|nr:unnamed protein product [Prunus armeniaca]
MATGQMMRHGWTSGNTGAILEPALDNWNDVLELWEMNGMRDKVFSDERGIGEVWGDRGIGGHSPKSGVGRVGLWR